MRVTVVGLGHMGQALARRLLERGHSVMVWNRRPGRAAPLVEVGATEAPGLQEAIAGAEVTLVAVTDDAALEELCLGESGILSWLSPEGILSNVSTVAPSTMRLLAEAGPPGRVLESPVMGAPAAVGRGEGQFYLGGPADVVDRLRPLWEDLGSDYVHCGPVGAAAAMKIVSNLQLMVGVTALAEAIVVARRHGLSDDRLRTVFSKSPVVSPASRARLDSLLSEEHPGWFDPAMARKDLRLALDLAAEGGVTLRLTPAVEELLGRLVEQEVGVRRADHGPSATGAVGWPDFSAVIEALKAT
jgi:3-hydroxyisobutyrate dehydrogenase-like beta-hydroxyacid dehydrogenase